MMWSSILVRAEAMAAEIKELQGEMADINTVSFVDIVHRFKCMNVHWSCNIVVSML